MQKLLRSTVRRYATAIGVESSYLKSSSPSTHFEEQSLPDYDPRQYYPAKLGDIYRGRYEVVGKLGYGSCSTVWLCHDKLKYEYKAVKIMRRFPGFEHFSMRERNIYKTINAASCDHPGRYSIRRAFEFFRLEGPYGTHQCLVLQPMQRSLQSLLDSSSGHLTLPMLRQLVRSVLLALDFHHTKTHITHTDLKPDNIMFSLPDLRVLNALVELEKQYPSVQKQIDDDLTIYQSRPVPFLGLIDLGSATLCDFSVAFRGHSFDVPVMIQPHIMRAPEIMMQMRWGHPIDIWNLGCLVWELAEGLPLFYEAVKEDHCSYSEYTHLAKMISLLGRPPTDWMARSPTTEGLLDEQGIRSENGHEALPDVTFESITTQLNGNEKSQFLAFIRRMLQWRPEERATAGELLNDPFLVERDFPQHLKHSIDALTTPCLSRTVRLSEHNSITA